MIIAFSVWLSITAGGVDVGGHVVLSAPLWGTSGERVTGLTIPHVSVIDPRNHRALEHERTHARQFDALGPAQPFAYALTGGRPFEDYQGSMWEPPPELHRNCPVLRIREAVEFMPCWRFP